MVARGWREGGICSNHLMGKELQFCKMEKGLERHGGDGGIIMGMYLMPLNCALKNGQNSKFMLCIFHQNLKK